MSATNIGTDILPTQAYTLEHEHGESWYTHMIFTRAAFERAGVHVPASPPRKWDTTWQSTFPDWDRTSFEHRQELTDFAWTAAHASGLCAYGGMPGRPFGDPPSVRVYTRYIVVSQFGGLDI